ncbi:MAG TPA: hypothetical protein VLA64_00440 [Azonexus sp.]|nr:hypothetical protein [Azonexus sp.]
MRYWLAALCFAMPLAAVADEMVPLCYGYGCLARDDIRYSEARLGEVRRLLHAAVNAEEERKMLAAAIGQLYAWAGEQSVIKNDRGGNYADDGPGKMDCIDHSTSTTRLLKVLEARGDLRWHRVLEADVRNWGFIFATHYSAVIEEIGEGEAGRFVVDSWFVDNGQPAVILPLDEWKKGAGPDV